MLNAVTDWLGGAELAAQALCLALSPRLFWLHALSDGLIALSYYSIPFALIYFAWKRSDLKYRWVFVLFGAFILACGTTHLMHVVVLYQPAYALEGLVKAVTAVVSLATAVLLWPLIPAALALPSPAQLARVNRELEVQIAERQAAEREVRLANAGLEERVAKRTRELELANAALREAKEEAERANRSKTTFFAAANHDLRQPVQALFFFSAALASHTTEQGRGILGDLNRSLNVLGSLMDSLFDISKLDAGVVTAHPAEFAISDLLQRMSAEFSPSARAKGVDLRVVPCSTTVHSDPDLLGRILQNLVANAVRYTPSGRILVGCRRSGGSLRIEVWDTGIGIPVDGREAIFHEFYQVNRNAREPEHGLGLGLAIVQRLARLLGHRLGLRSEPGRGSVFLISVPLAPTRCSALLSEGEAAGAE